MVRSFLALRTQSLWHTVIGVAGDVLSQQLNRVGRWNVYIPASDASSVSSVILRTVQDPLNLANSVRGRMNAIDRDIAVSEVFSLNQIVNRSAWRERFVSVLFGVFSMLALILAVVGLYGVLEYTVSLRTHEIGIRMAWAPPPVKCKEWFYGKGWRWRHWV